METVNKLPSETPTIGSRQISKGIEAGDVKHVVIASNCPDWLQKNFEKPGINVEQFAGDQKALGTALGKSFPVAAVGYKE